MRNKKQIRAIVFRTDADNNLFFTLLSFAASVTFTRVFLHLTGYPQLGGGEIHIAHVLWGGLFMFVAVLILLLYSNRWIHTLAAVFSGMGVGLFIDEVGKFVTQTNDYFYPAAAPIIYAFFLLTLLIYLVVRRSRKPDVRALMYEVLEQLDEFLDSDLSEVEAASIEKKLQIVANQKQQQELASLAKHLLLFFETNELVHPPHRYSLIERWRAFKQNKLFVWLPRTRMRLILTAAWLAWGIWSVFFPFRIFFNLQDNITLQQLFESFIQSDLISGAASLLWFQIRVSLSAALGLFMIIAAVIFLLGRERLALGMCFWILLISLTVSNLLLFYFDQFSTIFNTLIQFILLAGTLAYQKQYMSQSSATIQ